MLEMIRTFFGKQRERGRVVVQEGQLWRCTKCKMVFVTKEGGESHVCSERI
jgi:hypothetical protein